MSTDGSWIGSQLGTYQIVTEIGRGGMAVVYKARQPSLGRYVALKVLPATFGHDQEFVARFLREARSVARLNHPNIVHIYDTGVASGQYYIAMEYLEGGSLQERLAAGPLDEAEALRIVTEVSRALDYAHGQGVIHRDIKPSNILFSADPLRARDATAKVADFGIARAADGLHLTRTGIILGTPEYMAPEQAEGQPVDHRADLYALGLLLYQMLTGRSAFRRSTPHATLHAVIYEVPPPPRQIRPGLPVASEQVILKALAKRPQDRYQSGSELRRAFRASLAGGPRPLPTGRRRSLLPWILAGAAAALVILLGLLLLLSGGGAPADRLTPTAARPIVVATPAPVRPTSTLVPAAGTVPGPEPHTPLPPDPTAAEPITPLPPTDAPPPPTRPPTAHFGRLAFTSNRHGNLEIYVVNLTSGNVARLTNNNANDWLPDWSPDGARIAFTSHRRGSYDLWSMDGSGGGQGPLVATGAWDDYARWDPDGRRLALSTTAEGNSEIHVRQANGQLTRLTFTPAEDQWPDWAPDGRIIYTEGFKGSSNWDIFTMNGDGGQRQVWLGGPACDVQPTWSPDGQWVAFLRISRDTNGNGAVDEEDMGDVWVARANGSDPRSLTANAWARTPAWSPDSRWVAFTQLLDSNSNGRNDEQDTSDIWAVPLDGRDRVALVQGPHRDGDPSWAR